MDINRITTQKDDHILMIGLNRPEKRNAFDLEMFKSLGSAYGELHHNPDLRCGVLYAHGDHFTGGLDLPSWAPVFNGGIYPEFPPGGLDPLGLNEDNRLCKPMVIAVQGMCLTIGIELMLATDIRVAATNTRFGQIEIKRGLYPVGGATVRLMYEIGWGNAMRYLLTGDEISANEAYRMGLVQELTEPGKQLDKALEIARNIANQAPLGVRATLASSRLARTRGDKVAIDRLLPDLLPIMQSEDLKEGIQSFIERREAKFKGC